MLMNKTLLCVFRPESPERMDEERKNYMSGKKDELKKEGN
jgi:hypothetical protein